MPTAVKAQPVKKEKEDRIDCPSVLYESMHDGWALTDSLMGGTPAMREGRETWLPREPLETNTQYTVRLNRSFLYNAFKDTIKRLVAKPFSKTVTLVNGETLDDMLVATIDDVDKTGADLTQLGRDVMAAGIQYGLTHLFVDYPQMPENATKADEQAVNARPLILHIKPPQLLFWIVAYMPGGEQRLQEIRFKETRTEPNGLYGDQLVEYIRVVREQDWEVWRKDPDVDDSIADPWVMIDKGRNTLGRVPLLTYYTGRLGQFVGESPLTDLAWSNLAHYQTYSDYRNGVRFTTHGLLMLTGLSKEDMKQTTTLGPAAMFRSSNKEANGKYVEHSGKGISTARDYLRDLVEEMELLGMQPMVSRSGDATATGRAIDEARTFTDIQAWIRALELVLYDAVELAAAWIKVKLPADFMVNINNDFGISLSNAKDIDALITARQTKEITRKTFLEELRRRGVLNEMLDIDQELDNLEEEIALGTPGEVDLIDPDDDVTDDDGE